jgi:pimeloyl-ACP methyl ester carboxylesterase
MSDYLLVHGGFGGGWVWDEVAERLAKAGHRVGVVDQLPSAGTDPGSLGDLSADANRVRRALETVDEPLLCWWDIPMAGWLSQNSRTTRRCITASISPPCGHSAGSQR